MSAAFSRTVPSWSELFSSRLSSAHEWSAMLDSRSASPCLWHCVWWRNLAGLVAIGVYDWGATQLLIAFWSGRRPESIAAEIGEAPPL